MNTDWPALVDRFAGLDVLAVGDTILDSYLEGTTGRCCREAPVPSVTLSARHDAPGGGANTAVNVHELGARVSYLTVVGDDAEGGFLRRALRERGMTTSHVLTQPGRRTIAKHRVVAAGQILLRFDQGDTGAVSRAAEGTLIDRLRDLHARADAVIVSDYGYGTVTPAVIVALAELQARRPCVLVVDSRHRLPAFGGAGVTAVKPNCEEALELLGLDGFGGRSRAEAVLAHGERVLSLTGARVAAVTLDSEGAVVFERGRPPYRTLARPGRAHCVAGAGDTVVAVMALALAAGAAVPAMAELASAAAAVVVGKDGTAVCSARELREYFAPADRYVADPGRLAARVAFHKQQGRRVVFTNGCFDLLHRGHIAHLRQAKALGDVLVVGVNSDASARRLKGPGRPINTLDDRVAVLAALDCIDHLTAFDDDTARGLVRALRPDVFVKGGNHTRDSLPEAALVEELGGTVVILPYLDHRSTHGLIERIRDAAPLAASQQLAPVGEA